MNNIETLLYVEIADELEKISDMEMGSETHKTAVDEVTKLMDRAIELERLSIDDKDKRKVREFDEKFKLKQLEEEQKDRFVKNCIAVASIVVPSVITIWGVVKSIKFEETGTFTTVIGRGFINKLLPKK